MIVSSTLNTETSSALISKFLSFSKTSTFPFAKIFSSFLKYEIWSALIIIFFFSSLYSTPSVALRYKRDLLYSKFLAIIDIPSLVYASPPFFPLNRLPSSVISISVTLKLKISLEFKL